MFWTLDLWLPRGIPLGTLLGPVPWPIAGTWKLWARPKARLAPWSELRIHR